MKYLKIIFFTFFILNLFNIYSEGTTNQKKFIKGNISEKIKALRNAEGNEIIELSKAAINFSVENREILGEDLELSALAVAGIFAFPKEYIEILSFKEKQELASVFFKLFDMYYDNTVKIAVLTKIVVLNLPNEELVIALNSYMKSKAAVNNSALTKAAITSLGVIGDEESFFILYTCLDDKNWNKYNDELKKALAGLFAKAKPKIISMILSGNLQECRKIFDLTKEFDEIYQILKAEIAENILSRTIYLTKNSAQDDIILLQMDALDIMYEQKWTRGAQTAMQLFFSAKKGYEYDFVAKEIFIEILEKIPEIAPIEAVYEFSIYLMQINKETQINADFDTEDVVLALISVLGKAGDKNAFDALLAVINNYNFSDTVASAARDALAKLKWK